MKTRQYWVQRTKRLHLYAPELAPLSLLTAIVGCGQYGAVRTRFASATLAAHHRIRARRRTYRRGHCGRLATGRLAT